METIFELDNRIICILESLPYADDIAKEKLLNELAELNQLADNLETTNWN